MRISKLEKEIEELIRSYEVRLDEIKKKGYITEKGLMIFYNINKIRNQNELYIIFENFYIVKRYKK